MRRSYRKTSHERKTKPFHICQAISVARLVSKPEQHPVVSNKVHPFWRGCQGSTISNGCQRNHSQPLLWGPHPDVVEFWVYCSLRGQVSLGIARIAATIACEWFLDPWGLSHKHRTELKFDFESLGRTAENLKNSSLRSVCALILFEPCQQFYCTNGLDCVLNVNGNGFSEKVQRCSWILKTVHENRRCFSVLEILPVIFLRITSPFLAITRLLQWYVAKIGWRTSSHRPQQVKDKVQSICPCWHMLALFQNTTSTRILCGYLLQVYNLAEWSRLFLNKWEGPAQTTWD